MSSPSDTEDETFDKERYNQWESDSNSDSDSDSVSSADSDTLSPRRAETEEMDAGMLADTIISEIKAGTYTCLICTGEIDYESEVWSCDLCCRVYDLDCIRDWAVRGSSTTGGTTEAAGVSWRCPFCGADKHELPMDYRCWCGKVMHPEPNPLSPHSCGQTCGAPLGKCVHGCPLECHPGRHSSCQALGPPLPCHCGRCVQTLPCSLTPYNEGWQCELLCQEVMPCGLHVCGRPCHSGVCGSCNSEDSVSCFCGKQRKVEKPCRELRDPALSYDSSDWWLGRFACDVPCGEPMDCGVHFCGKGCHATFPGVHRCELAPERVKTCHCGKRSVKDVLGAERSSCADPIPSCGAVCGRELPCGHKCYWTCHDGPCAPCFAVCEARCACGNSVFDVPCAFVQAGLKPQCQHKDSTLLSCRRHRCGAVCCPAEPVAREMERQMRRNAKMRVASFDELVAQSLNQEPTEPEVDPRHICYRICNLPLKCGSHRCLELCHTGPCPPCLQSSADDVACACGRTVLRAPIRCGTEMPKCPFPCQRVPACGHRAVPHDCHGDDVNCPPCPTLVAKQCMCGKAEVRAACSVTSVSCGRVCGAQLSCGRHTCPKTCHRPGNCVAKCGAVCGKLRKCGHPCPEKCHEGSPCPETRPCAVRAEVRCECGNIRKRIACDATADRGTRIGPLPCTEECRRLARNRRLLEALEIGPKPSATDSEVPYTPEVLAQYRQQPVWCEQVEKILREFVTANRANQPGSRRAHGFPPMRHSQRKFIHLLCEAYRLTAESKDQEPFRNVYVYYNDRAEVPEMSLAEAQRVAAVGRTREAQTALEGSAAEPAEYNAFLVQECSFGVTREDVLGAVASAVAAAGELTDWEARWVAEDQFVVFRVDYVNSTKADEQRIIRMLKSLQTSLQTRGVAFGAAVCRLSEDGARVEKVRVPEVRTESKEVSEQEADVAGDEGEEEAKDSNKADAVGGDSGKDDWKEDSAVISKERKEALEAYLKEVSTVEHWEDLVD